MKLIKQNNYSCLAAATAMVMDLEMQDIFDGIGHNGLDVVNVAEKPFCFKGIHPQEIIDFAIMKGYVVTEIHIQPALSGGGFVYDVFTAMQMQKRLLKYLGWPKSILQTVSSRGIPHAVAWDGYKVYDSVKDKPQPIENYNVQRIFIFCDNPIQLKEKLNSSL